MPASARQAVDELLPALNDETVAVGAYCSARPAPSAGVSAQTLGATTRRASADGAYTSAPQEGSEALRDWLRHAERMPFELRDIAIV